MAPPLLAVVAGWDAMAAAIAALLTPGVLPVHVAQEASFRRPVGVGDRLTSTAAVASIAPGPAGAVARIHMETADADGRPVCDSAATVYLAGAVLASFGEAAETLMTAAEVTAPAGSATSVDYAVDHDQAERYADASGDHNPIHLDDEAAQAAGFDGTVVHGMCVLALACRAAVETLCGGDPRQVRGVTARFGKPVRPGDLLRISLGPPSGEDGVRRHRLRAETDRGVVLKRGAIELERG